MRISNTNPIFWERTKDGEAMHDIASRLIKNRVIYIDCEIDEELASQVTSLLFLLDRESEDESADDRSIIKLWINSPGGDLTGFFAIYDMMQRVASPIRTVCIGHACSASALLLATGSPGMRYVMPHGRVMIHQIQVGGLEGSNAEIEIETKELKQVQERLTEILARHTGQTKSKIKRDTNMDKWFSAEKAVEYGIADKILEPQKNVPKLVTRGKKGDNEKK